MRYAVIGGGPGGLYFALLAKKANARDEVVVVERNPPDATFGWGVVFSEETLGSLRDADYETYTEIGESFARWTAIDIYYRDTKLRSRGHVFTGISRKVLLHILQRRCRSLGVRLEFEREVRDIHEFDDADLIVGADGINGLVRRTYAEHFKPQLAIHPTKYVWFGSDLPLDAFTFIFRANEHGLFQVHAYPFDARTCTFIVECPEDAWRRAGLESASEAESIAYCEALFKPELRGCRLLSNRSLWINFATLRQDTWHHGKVVLLGDAAHTAHFSIGSGTKLAMEDSIALVDALRRHPDLPAALNDYEMERQPVVDRFQEAALESSGYFEHVSRYASFEPKQFAFNLLTRSRRITYVNLTQRDPDFVRTVDSWFAAQATGSPDGVVRLSPPPMFVGFRIGNLQLDNRVVVAAGADLPRAKASGAGLLISEFVSVTAGGRITPQTPVFDRQFQDQLRLAVDEAHRSGARVALQLGHAGRRGSMRPRAGLLISEFVSVTAEGRITQQTPVFDRAYQDQLRLAVDEAHRSGARVALQLGHAGRRGSMRPRAEGVDRPLRDGGWRLLAPSAIAYTPHAVLPRQMSRNDIEHLVEVFAAAAQAAASTGIDILEVNMAHGYLLGSFISPLTNQRSDDYSGSLEKRLRFPLEVLDGIRAKFQGPLMVRISASDQVSGGIDLDAAVLIACQLKAHGADLIHPVLGQTVWEGHPDYRRLFGVPASDRIRNEAAIPTLASGNIISGDDVNTVLAGGRADLCLLDLSSGS